MKKHTQFGVLLVVCLISACGQPGPLYLPTDKPPVYVAPEDSTNKDAETKPEDVQKEIKSPPQPENNQPKEQ